MDTQKITDGEIKALGNGHLNLWQRISGVLWGGPVKTFEDIAARPAVAGLAVLLLALSLIFMLLALPKLKEFTLWTVQNTPDMPAQLISAATTMAVVGVLAASVLGPPLMWLIMAGLLKLFNAFSGEKASFKTLFAVAVYSYLPLMLATAIQTALIMASPAQNMDKISTGLTLLLPGEQTGRLYMIMKQIDPFSIWGLVLLALGSSVAMRVPAVKTGAYLGVLWLIYVLGAGLLSRLSVAGV